MIHCSDSLWGDAADITCWHRQRGWDDIGYNWVILSGRLREPADGIYYYEHKNGKQEDGRDPKYIGAHALYFNESHLSVCLIGKHHFSWSQFETLFEIVRMVKREHIPDLKAENIIGHYEVNKHKTCPNIEMNSFRKLLALAMKSNIKFYELRESELWQHDQEEDQEPRDVTAPVGALDSWEVSEETETRELVDLMDRGEVKAVDVKRELVE